MGDNDLFFRSKFKNGNQELIVSFSFLALKMADPAVLDERAIRKIMSVPIVKVCCCAVRLRTF